MAAILVPFQMNYPQWCWEAHLDDARPEVHAANIAFWAYIANDQIFATAGLISLAAEGKKPSMDDIGFTTHHVLIILTWWSFLTEQWGHLFALAAMMTEVTAFFFAMHFFLRKMKLTKSTIYTINGLAMLVTWYIFRIWGYVLFMGLRIWQLRGELLDITNDQFLRNCFVLVNWVVGAGLQLFWGWKITLGAKRALFGGGSKNKKKSDEEPSEGSSETDLTKSKKAQ